MIVIFKLNRPQLVHIVDRKALNSLSNLIENVDQIIFHLKLSLNHYLANVVQTRFVLQCVCSDIENEARDIIMRTDNQDTIRHGFKCEDATILLFLILAQLDFDWVVSVDSKT